MVETSSNWTLRTDIARATPCVCGASNGSAFSAEVVVSAAVLVDFGGDVRAYRGGGGGRLLSPRGVGIVSRPREAVLWSREAVPLYSTVRRSGATAGNEAAAVGPRRSRCAVERC